MTWEFLIGNIYENSYLALVQVITNGYRKTIKKKKEIATLSFRGSKGNHSSQQLILEKNSFSY